VLASDRISRDELFDAFLCIRCESEKENWAPRRGVPEIAEAGSLEEGVVAGHHGHCLDEHLGTAHLWDTPFADPTKRCRHEGVTEPFTAIIRMDHHTGDPCRLGIALRECLLFGERPKFIRISVGLLLPQKANMSFWPVGRLQPIGREDETSDMPDERSVRQAPVHDR